MTALEIAVALLIGIPSGILIGYARFRGSEYMKSRKKRGKK